MLTEVSSASTSPVVLDEHQEIVFGRMPGTGVKVVDDKRISIRHCAVRRIDNMHEVDAGGGSRAFVVLVDFPHSQKSNVTHCNGEPVPEQDRPPPVNRIGAAAATLGPSPGPDPWRWVMLQDGDTIALLKSRSGKEWHVFRVTLF